MKAADNNIPTPIIAGTNTFFLTSFFEDVAALIVDYRGQKFSYNHCLPM
jgi:hypothetical protein